MTCLAYLPVVDTTRRARPVAGEAARPTVATRPAVSRVRYWRRVALAAFGVLLIVEVILVWPYLSRAVGALARPDVRWLTLAIAAELVSMAAFARVQRRMLSAGGQRASIGKMLALTYAANAVSVTLPGGAALSSGYVFKRLRSWGASVPAAGFTVLASGVLSTVAFAILAVTCAVLADSGGFSSLAIVAGVVAVGVAALVIRRRRSDVVWRVAGRGLVRTNRILHRAPDAGLAALQRFAREVSAIKPRSRDWWAGLGFAGLNWVADLACLIASCHAVGAGRSTVVLVMVAYVAGMSASSLSLLPGGFGVVDAAMIIALTSGGVSTVSATAGVLVYRLISFALIVILGWLVWTASWLVDRRAVARLGASEPDPVRPAEVVTYEGISDTL
ncbi:MAG: YbhN family protein [Jatrophihabitantaceae bacterium]